MKQLIFSLMFALLPLTASTAQDDVAMIFPEDHLRVSGTYFEKALSGHTVWSNATGSSFTHAAYANYDGVTYVTLTSYGKQVDVDLSYDVKVRKGKLEMVVVDEKNNIVYSKTFSENQRKTIKVTLEPFEEYRIKFIGKNTKGSYYCQWTEL